MLLDKGTHEGAHGQGHLLLMRGSPTRRSSAPMPSSGSWESSEDVKSNPAPSAKELPILRRRQTGRTDHPLGGDDENGGSPPDSRPTLRRLTSETERQVAESSRSGSERGSLDMLRMSVTTNGEGGGSGSGSGSGSREVEVLIHHVGFGGKDSDCELMSRSRRLNRSLG